MEEKCRTEKCCMLCNFIPPPPLKVSYPDNQSVFNRNIEQSLTGGQTHASNILDTIEHSDTDRICQNMLKGVFKNFSSSSSVHLEPEHRGHEAADEAVMVSGNTCHV